MFTTAQVCLHEVFRYKQMTVLTLEGTLRTFQSARISYVFGWSGPSITLDTACSSSVVALHQAARSIIAGDCRAALVGAVNTITSPDVGSFFRAV